MRLALVVCAMVLTAFVVHARTLTEQRVKNFQLCVGYDGTTFSPIVTGQTETEDATPLSVLNVDPRPALNAADRADLAAIVVKVYNKLHAAYAIPTATPIPTSTPTKTATPLPTTTPTPTSTPAGSLCGDGVTFGAELCDDGNTTNGDGCSGACIPD